MQKQFANAQIEVMQGNIVKQDDMAAIVNAANAYLQPGGGVAGAIHRAAGPQLAQKGQELAPIKPGQAVITDAYELPNDYVIHCLGPVYTVDRPSDQLLADCYRNALQIANDYGLDSIALPAISAGAFGYPLQEAANIAIQTTATTLAKLDRPRYVRFVLFSEGDYQAFETALSNC